MSESAEGNITNASSDDAMILAYEGALVREWQQLKDNAIDRIIADKSMPWMELANVLSLKKSLIMPVMTQDIGSIRNVISQGQASVDGNTPKPYDVDVVKKLVKVIIAVSVSQTNLELAKPALMALNNIFRKNRLVPPEVLQEVTSAEMLALLLRAANHGNETALELFQTSMISTSLSCFPMEPFAGVIFQHALSTHPDVPPPTLVALATLLQCSTFGNKQVGPQSVLESASISTSFTAPMRFLSDDVILMIMGASKFASFNPKKPESDVTEGENGSSATSKENDVSATEMCVPSTVSYLQLSEQIIRLRSLYAVMEASHAENGHISSSGVIHGQGHFDEGAVVECRLAMLTTALELFDSNLNSMSSLDASLQLLIKDRQNIVPLNELQNSSAGRAVDDDVVTVNLNKEAALPIHLPLPNGFQLSGESGNENIRFPNGPIYYVSGKTVPETEASGDVITKGRWTFTMSGNSAFAVGIVPGSSTGGTGAGLVKGFINSGCSISGIRDFTTVQMSSKVIVMTVDRNSNELILQVDGRDYTVSLTSGDFPCRFGICGHNGTTVVHREGGTSSATFTAGTHSGLMRCGCGHSLGSVSYPLDPGYYHLNGSCTWTCCGLNWQESTCPVASTITPTITAVTSDSDSEDSEDNDFPFEQSANDPSQDFEEKGDGVPGKTQSKLVGTTVLELAFQEILNILCSKALINYKSSGSGTFPTRIRHFRCDWDSFQSQIIEVDDATVALASSILRLFIKNGMVKLLWCYLLRPLIYKYAVMVRLCVAVIGCDEEQSTRFSAEDARVAISEIQQIQELFHICLQFIAEITESSLVLDSSLSVEDEDLNSTRQRRISEGYAAVKQLESYSQKIFADFVADHVLNNLVISEVLRSSRTDSRVESRLGTEIEAYLHDRFRKGGPISNHPCLILLGLVKRELPKRLRTLLDEVWVEAQSSWMLREFSEVLLATSDARNHVISLHRLILCVKDCQVLEFGDSNISTTVTDQTFTKFLNNFDAKQVDQLSSAVASVVSNLLEAHSKPSSPNPFSDVSQLENQIEICSIVVQLLCSNGNFSRFGQIMDRMLARRLLSRNSVSTTYEKLFAAHMAKVSFSKCIIDYVKSLDAATASSRRLILRSVDNEADLISPSGIRFAFGADSGGLDLLIVGSVGRRLLQLPDGSASLNLPPVMQQFVPIVSGLVSSNKLTSSLGIEQSAAEAMKLPSLPVTKNATDKTGSATSKSTKPVPIETSKYDIPAPVDPPSTPLKLQWIHDASTVVIALTGLANGKEIYFSVSVAQAVVLFSFGTLNESSISIGTLSSHIGANENYVLGIVESLHPGVSFDASTRIVTLNISYLNSLSSKPSGQLYPISLIPNCDSSLDYSFRGQILSHWDLCMKVRSGDKLITQYSHGNGSSDPAVSSSSQAGGHTLRNLIGSEKCPKCNMYGPSHETSKYGCNACGLCAVCCMKKENPCTKCPTAEATRLRSRHVAAHTAQPFGGFGMGGGGGATGNCIDCKLPKSDRNSCSGHHCSVCKRCAPCAVKYPFCMDQPPNFRDINSMLKSLPDSDSEDIENRCISHISKIFALRPQFSSDIVPSAKSLFSSDAVTLMLHREFLRARSRLADKCHIFLVENDVTNWRVQFYGFDPSSVLGKDLDTVQGVLGFNYIELSLRVSIDSYPLGAPVVTVIKPQLLDALSVMKTISPRMDAEAGAALSWGSVGGLESLMHGIFDYLQAAVRIDMSSHFVGAELEKASYWSDLYRHLQLMQLAQIAFDSCDFEAKKASKLIETTSRDAKVADVSDGTSTIRRTTSEASDDEEPDDSDGSDEFSPAAAGASTGASPVKPNVKVITAVDRAGAIAAFALDSRVALTAALVLVFRSLQQVVPRAQELGLLAELTETLSMSFFMKALKSVLELNSFDKSFEPAIIPLVALELVEIISSVRGLQAVVDRNSTVVGGTNLSDLVELIENNISAMSTALDKDTAAVTKLSKEKKQHEDLAKLKARINTTERILQYAITLVSTAKCVI